MDGRVLVTSANLTLLGLTPENGGNLEMGLEAPGPAAADLSLWAKELVEASVPVLQAHIDHLVEWAGGKAPPSPAPPAPSQPSLSEVMEALGVPSESWVEAILATRIRGVRLRLPSPRKDLLGKGGRTSGKQLTALVRFSQAKPQTPQGTVEGYHFSCSVGEARAWRAGMLDVLILVPGAPDGRLTGPLTVWPARLQFKGHFLRPLDAGRGLGRELEQDKSGQWAVRIRNSLGSKSGKVQATCPLTDDRTFSPLSPR